MDQEHEQLDIDRFLENGYPEDTFDGRTYDPELDYARLGKQMRKVFSLMRDGRWRTLRDISELTEQPEASVSARLRDLRKPKFGAYTVERRRDGDGQHGVHSYRLVPKGDTEPR